MGMAPDAYLLSRIAADIEKDDRVRGYTWSSFYVVRGETHGFGRRPLRAITLTQI